MRERRPSINKQLQAVLYRPGLLSVFSGFICVVCWCVFSVFVLSG